MDGLRQAVDGMDSVAGQVAAWAGAVAMVAVYGRLMWADVRRAGFTRAVLHFALLLAVSGFGWWRRGLPHASYAVVLAVACLAMIAATGGHPGVLYQMSAGTSGLTKRQEQVMYLRITGTLMLCFGLLVALMQQAGLDIGV